MWISYEYPGKSKDIQKIGEMGVAKVLSAHATNASYIFTQAEKIAATIASTASANSGDCII